MDLDLQKEISVIWPHLSQKSLDLLVPIHKGDHSPTPPTKQQTAAAFIHQRKERYTFLLS